MDSTGLLVEAYGRLRPIVHGVVEGLRPAELTDRMDREANTIAWLVWHLTRVQDHHLAQAFGRDQIWTTSDWPRRFDLPADPQLTGYGADSEEVAAVRPGSAELLTGYYDAVHDSTLALLSNVTRDDLDRVVDPSYDPPVTLGVRLVSVLADDLQHVGQAAFVRGAVERSRS